MSRELQIEHLRRLIRIQARAVERARHSARKREEEILNDLRRELEQVEKTEE